MKASTLTWQPPEELHRAFANALSATVAVEVGAFDLTVGTVCACAISNQCMSASRRRIDLAVRFILAAVVVSDPNINLIVIAAGANVRHDQVFLEVWKPDRMKYVSTTYIATTNRRSTDQVISQGL